MKFFNFLGLFLFLLAPSAPAKPLVFGGQEFPPFNWTQNGKIVGGFKEAVETICTKLKYECSFETTTVARALILAKEGQIDGILSLIPNAEREKFFNFTHPIVKTHIAYLRLDKGNQLQPFTNPAQFSGWKILAVRGTVPNQNAKKMAQQYPQIEVVDETTYETLISHLISYGNHPDAPPMAGIGASVVLKYYAQKAGHSLSLVYELPVEQYTLALSKKTVDLKTLQAFNQAIDEMGQNGELEKILAPYNLKTREK